MILNLTNHFAFNNIIQNLNKYGTELIKYVKYQSSKTYPEGPV